MCHLSPNSQIKRGENDCFKVGLEKRERPFCVVVVNTKVTRQIIDKSIPAEGHWSKGQCVRMTWGA